MKDPASKACEDYSALEITRGTSYETGTAVHFVERDGRRLFETRNSLDAALFAEELYERILTVRMIRELLVAHVKNTVLS